MPSAAKTLRFKLVPTAEQDSKLLDYLTEKYNEIVGRLLRATKHSRLYIEPSKPKLHRLTYGWLRRDYDLHSNHITSARDRVVEMVKASNYHKAFPTPESIPVRLFRGKTYRLLPNRTVEVVVKPKVCAKGILLGEDSWYEMVENAKGAELLKRNDEYYLYIVVRKEIGEYRPRYAVGIDTNLDNLTLACVKLANTVLISWHKIDFQRVHGLRLYHRNRSDWLQSVKARGDDKEGNILRNEVEEIANEVVKFVKPYDDCVVGIETLDKLRKKLLGRAKSKSMRYLYSSFFYGLLLRRMKEKLEWHGIQVVKVDPRRTSTTCSKCGNKGVRTGEMFKCLVCNYEICIHLNASVNIAKLILPALKREVSGALL